MWESLQLGPSPASEVGSVVGAPLLTLPSLTMATRQEFWGLSVRPTRRPRALETCPIGQIRCTGREAGMDPTHANATIHVAVVK